MQRGHVDNTILSLNLNLVEQEAEQNFLARLCFNRLPHSENPASLPHVGHLLLINGFLALIKFLIGDLTEMVSYVPNKVNKHQEYNNLTFGVIWAK